MKFSESYYLYLSTVRKINTIATYSAGEKILSAKLGTQCAQATMRQISELASTTMAWDYEKFRVFSDQASIRLRGPSL